MSALVPGRTLVILLPSALLLLFGLDSGCQDGKSPEAGAPSGKSRFPEPDPVRPPLRMVLSGWLEGYLEPCGCASAQSGGLDRRAFWLKQNKHLYDLWLEGGNLLAGDNPLERLKLPTILTVLGALLEYPVLPLGPTDLSLDFEVLEDFHEAFGPPFLVTDLRRGGKKGPFPTWRILESGGYEILALNLVSRIGSSGEGEGRFHVLPAGKAVSEALAEARKAGPSWDLCLVFAYQGRGVDARSLAKSLPGVDLLIAFEQDFHLPGKPEIEIFGKKDGKPGHTLLAFPGTRGRTLMKLTLQPAAGGGWTPVGDARRFDLPAPRDEKRRNGIPLRADPEVFTMLQEFKREVAEAGILEKMAGLAATKNGARYAGNDACKICHAGAAEVLENTMHAKAWQVLAERERMDRLPLTRHPDCVRCHAVGYGEKTGFISFEKTPKLASVGCESCHGPGSKHIEARVKMTRSSSEAERSELEKEAALSKVKPERCYSCHTMEQSPGFQYLERWKRIRHE